MTGSLEEQIKELENELRETSYNKATSKHIGRVKAKIARLKDEAVTRAIHSAGGADGFSVKKSGRKTGTCRIGPRHQSPQSCVDADVQDSCLPLHDRHLGRDIRRTGSEQSLLDHFLLRITCA